MNLKQLLKDFHHTQTGLTSFNLPTGDRVDLTNPVERKSITSWILTLFGNNEALASAVVSKLAPVALTKGAPWPYLLSSLWNIGLKRSNIMVDAPYCTLKARFIQIFGACRLRLLNNISSNALASNNNIIELSGATLDITNETDRSALLNWFISNPHETFMQLSPQYMHLYEKGNSLETLIARIFSSKLANDPSKAIVDSLVMLRNKALPNTEIKDILNLIIGFLTTAKHPSLFIYYAYNNDILDVLDSVFTLDENTLDKIRCDWVAKAIELGIITHPLDWFVTLLVTKKDTVEDWRIYNWCNDKEMCNTFGLVPIYASSMLKEIYG